MNSTKFYKYKSDEPGRDGCPPLPGASELSQKRGPAVSRRTGVEPRPRGSDPASTDLLLLRRVHPAAAADVGRY